MWDRRRKVEMNDIQTLSYKQTKKLIENALKRNFPDVQFNLRQMEQNLLHLQVSWIGGPAEERVSLMAYFYSRGDRNTFHTQWLLPDGSITLASKREVPEGTEPERHNEYPSPDPDATQVLTGVNFIRYRRIERQKSKRNST
jgi:hypothetical protein